MKGIISTYKEDRGFGFIDGEDGNRYFLHVSELMSDEDPACLVHGAAVEFQPSTEVRGLRARHIQIRDHRRQASATASDDVLWFDQSPEPPWVVRSACPYRIQSRSISRGNARQMLMDRARRLGANAVCHVKHRRSLWHGHEYLASPCGVTQQEKGSSATPVRNDALSRQTWRLFAEQALEAKEHHQLMKRRGLLVLLPLTIVLAAVSLPALAAIWLFALTLYPVAASEIRWLRHDASGTTTD